MPTEVHATVIRREVLRDGTMDKLFFAFRTGESAGAVKAGEVLAFPGGQIPVGALAVLREKDELSITAVEQSDNWYTNDGMPHHVTGINFDLQRLAVPTAPVIDDDDCHHVRGLVVRKEVFGARRSYVDSLPRDRVFLAVQTLNKTCVFARGRVLIHAFDVHTAAPTSRAALIREGDVIEIEIGLDRRKEWFTGLPALDYRRI